MVNIFIDPGHGGRDPGATANGLQEKDVCLALALKLQHILKQQYVGHRIKLSRTHDQTLSLTARTEMANDWNADYLVSIHINAGGGTGFESYIYNGSYDHKTRTNRLRSFIHEEIVNTSGFRNRGKKEANFHMLRASWMPAILTENGFIDTVRDAERLQDTAFLNDIAAAHARGIAEAFGLRKMSSNPDVSPSTENNDDLGPKIHMIQQGDTLYSLAKRYGTTVVKLIQWNTSIIPERLKIGQQLIVRAHAGVHHTIKKGDTLWRLGKENDTTVERLLKLNPDIDANQLQIGEKVRVG